MPEIKLIHEDTNISDLKMSTYDWDVVVHGVPYQVYDIEGYVHSIGGHFGANSLWACPRGEKPTAANLVEYSGRGATWSILVEQVNSIKSKWDETEISSHYAVFILRNGSEFYSFGANDAAWGWAKAYSLLINKIHEGPINFNKYGFVESEILGHKLWYRERPYTVVSYVDGQCCAIVVPGHFDDWRSHRYDRHALKLDLIDGENMFWYELYPLSSDD